MTNSRIKQVVLRRARFIHTVRPLFSSTVVASSLVLVSLYSIAQKVWVARVLENIPMQSGAGAVARFFEAAFMNTSFVVQALSLLLIFAMFWVARDTARSIHGIARFA